MHASHLRPPARRGLLLLLAAALAFPACEIHVGSASDALPAGPDAPPDGTSSPADAAPGAPAVDAGAAVDGAAAPRADAGTTPKDAAAAPIGTLVYEKVASGVHQYDFASGQVKRLFDGSFPERLPSGETVVVDDYYQRVYVWNATGTSRTKLFESPSTFTCYEPRVSPDGKLVAFTHANSSYDNPDLGTLVYARDGQRRAFFAGLFSPSWTPDGRLVMSGSWRYPASLVEKVKTPMRPGLFVSDAALTTATRFDPQLDDPPPLQPAVSPDGKAVAFVLNHHLWRAGLDGAGLRQVTDGAMEESHPTWSPDGAWLAAVAYGTFEITYHTSIVVLPATGAGPLAIVPEAMIWPRQKDAPSSSLSNGRLNGSSSLSWR
jgi:hypothetical protein